MVRVVATSILAFAALGAMPTTSAAQVIISGGIHIGVPVPAPPIVVYDHYYQPPPPPVLIYMQPPAPPPPVVLVRPAPLLQQPLPLLPEPEFESQIGIGLRLNGAFTGMNQSDERDPYRDDYDHGVAAMGGAGLFLRFHSFPNLAFELGLDGYGGQGYVAGSVRSEIPATLAALYFFGRHTQAFRLFLLTGIGVAWAKIGEDEPRVDEPVYVGGLAGIGVEWRLAPFLALEADLRGFVRQRVNERPTDPAYRTDSLWNDGSCNSAGECTDYEGGGTFHLGAILYF